MKFLFNYISILNIFDAFLTAYGLENSLIEEGNPLMDRLYEVSPGLFIATKISFSVFLYLFIFLKKMPESWFVKSIAMIAAAIYTGVFLLHGFWVVLTIF